MKRILLAFGFLVGLWAVAAMVSGVIASGGIVPLLSSYMYAIGLVTPLYTLVDFYTHIKGIEYLICVAFFVIFSVFFKYVDKEEEEAKITA